MQANDSVSVTPGSGALVATHAPGDGKEYQVVVIADSAGQIDGSNPVYRLVVPPQAVGASKVFLDLFNAGGSGKRIKILAAFAYPNMDTAVTGTVGVRLHLTRTSAVGTGGTAINADDATATNGTISKFNPDDAALPAQITARVAPTGGATAGAVLATRSVFTEETNAGTAIAGAIGAEFVRNDGAKVIVPENSGVRFLQGTVASVGSIGFEITFELV